MNPLPFLAIAASVSFGFINLSRSAEPAAAKPAANSHIIVYGEVTRQGRYTIDPKGGPGVMDALHMAGGAKDRANLKKVKVVRDGKTIYVDVVKGPSILLKAGDVIIVPEKIDL